MNHEFEIAKELVEGFYEVKEQTPDLLAIQTKVKNLRFDNLDFNLVIDFLNKLNFKGEMLKDNGFDYIQYSPLTQKL